MAIPPLVNCATEAEYRAHYELAYCCGPITTFDGYEVRFRKDQFDHCFFESSQRNQIKDQFSRQRAERIDWIKAVLEDPDADLFVGWDRKRKRYDNTHRVAVVCQDYVVIIRLTRLTGATRAQFVTAYVADSPSTVQRIRRSPSWQKPSA